MLKMALQQLLYGLAGILLLCNGCHSQQPECGRVSVNSRIVGGQDASPGEWPWQAVLKKDGDFFCGGSLITNQWVLTAAHCISPLDLSSVDVHLGVISRTGPNPNEMTRSLEDIICHPQYDQNTMDNDICLLKLSSPVNYTDYVRPVCLAAGNSTFYDEVLSWVTGFGSDGSESPPEILQEVRVPIVGNNRCGCYNKESKEITENMLCAGFTSGGKDSCQGDSGGPLVVRNNSAWVQGGVVSFGEGCALPERPGVYARVSQYQKWISDTVTGMKPGFVEYLSSGYDMDAFFACSTPSPPYPSPTPTDDSIFGSGANLGHFSYFASLSLLALVLQVFA